jgi:hypothetical protein
MANQTAICSPPTHNFTGEKKKSSTHCGPNYFSELQQSGTNSLPIKSLILDVWNLPQYNKSLGNAKIKHC